MSQVKVWYRPNAGASQQLIRRYDFLYDDHDSPEFYTLRRIRQYGADGSQLPETVFTYYYDTSHKIGWKTDDGWEHKVQRPFLDTAENGYGGVLDIDYQSYCLPEGQDCASGIGWGMRQRVNNKTLSPGVGTSMISTYSYADPGYKWMPSNPLNPLEQFIGFGQATEEAQDASQQAIQRTVTHFYNTWYDNQGHPDDPMKSKILTTETGQWNDGTASWDYHTETVNSYTTYTETVAAGWPAGVTFVYVSQVVDKQCLGATCQSRRTEYFYETNRQKNQDGVPGQYGNLTHIDEYDDQDQLYRHTYRSYPINDVDYIVDRLGVETATDAGGNLVASTWYYYDGHGYNTAPDALGELTRLRKVIRDEGTGGSHELKTSDTSFVYDGWGNVTDQTVYGVEGSTTFNSSWGLVSDSPATGDARTTETDYDDTHHTFPVEVRQPQAGGVQLIEKREYYEVNEAGGGGEGLPGQLKRVWDTNNDDSTWYQYDSFGRLRYQWRPGETTWNTAQAWVAYGYDDTARRLYTRQRDDDGGSSPTYLKGWQFYDGLGRLIQSQAESATSGQSILTNRAYDAAGRLEKESLSYFYEASGGTYRTPDWGQPYTAYQYDALGRVSVVTNPDTTSVQHFYGVDDGDAWESVYDENGHAKRYLKDAFGRLAQVEEYVDPWPTHYTTLYTYDVRDNLTDVWDEDDNHSHMEYDLLGRKETMHDPDMGDWSYTYDALGNLETQTDAKGQTISFQYDALNRLTAKLYPTGPNVYYKYDDFYGGGSSMNSWGRLRVSFVAESNNIGASQNRHWYEYDDRGRVAKERTFLDGAAYDVYYTYDAADRVKTTTYPDGEVVTSEYNTQGLPETLTGDATYVTGATYTALGQADLLQFGNGTQTDYIYYDATGNYRLYKIKTGLPGQPSVRQHLEYAYDNVGNVETITDRHGVGTWNDPQVQTFEYDALDRLTHAWTTGGTAGAGEYDRTYQYNAIGNLTSKAGVEYTYPTSGANSVQPHAVRQVTGTGGTSKTVKVRARGTCSVGGTFPIMQLWVNGSQVREWTQVIDTWADYTQSTPLSGNDQIEVVFTNGSNCDLFVDYVEVNGQRIEAEGGATIIDKAPGGTAFDGLNVITGQQNIWWSGALRFVVGPDASAACYDANGNMTWRLQDGVAYEQTWDYENRLASATDHAADQTTTFTYDGNGVLVKKVVDGATTVYVGQLYEKDLSTAQVTKYYYFNGQRVAMRKDNVVQYLLGDHLNSTSLVLDASGAKVAESRYYPYGEERWTSDTLPTNYRFTGQRLEADLGLYQMGARFYDPALARWLSADTIVPEPGNPQALNRYSYCVGNPVRFVDPTGYFTEDQLRDWYGVDWEMLFDAIWQSLLRNAEFGDVILYSDNQSAMFIQTDSGALTMWSMSTSDDFSGRGTSSLFSMANSDLIGWYRSKAVNWDGGPSSSQEGQGVLDPRFLDFELKLAWDPNAPNSITLGNCWSRSVSTNQSVSAIPKTIPFGEFGNTDWVQLGTMAVGAGIALYEGASVGSALLVGLGGVAGLVVLPVELWLWATHDTYFVLQNDLGKLPIMPVPEPP